MASIEPGEEITFEMKKASSAASFSTAKYMARHRRPPSQGWRTFLLNHADGIASIDLFVVPTISFKLLYGLLILRHDRRRILLLGVTTSPTAEWIARQRGLRVGGLGLVNLWGHISGASAFDCSIGCWPMEGCV